MQLSETIDGIILFHSHIEEFWGNGGWGPEESAEILRNSRLDRLTQMAHLLPRWLKGEMRGEPDLILAWTVLGSLTEGALKWFLSVHAMDYSRNPVRANKKDQPPDELFLGKTLNFYEDYVWTVNQKVLWKPLLDLICCRRNSIHTFQDCDIGNWAEWEKAVKGYLCLLLKLELQVPYPPEYYSYPANVNLLQEKVTEWKGWPEEAAYAAVVAEARKNGIAWLLEKGQE